MDEQIYLLPVWDTISAGWDKVKGAKASIWAGLAIVFLVILGFYLLDSMVKHFSSTLGNIITLIAQVIIFLLEMGLLYIGIKRAFDEPISYRLMFRAFEAPITLRIIGVYVLQFLIFLPVIVVSIMSILLLSGQSILATIAGILILIIAFFVCIFLAIRMIVSMAFILDQGTNPWPAIKMSFQATRSNVWRLIAVLLLQSLIVIISMIPLGIGLIWTLPFSIILYGVIYKRLLVNTSNK
jgi:hypothetical protein